MRIFVTGGTGFIGKPTVRELQKYGHKLLILVPESERVQRNSGAYFVVGNLSNPNKWARRLKRFRPQAALHMAWEGLPDYSSKTSIKNFNYGLNLLSRLAKIRCRKVVITGSCWEYGISKGKLSEDMPVYPMNAFSAAKNALHWLGRELARENGMQFVWTRLFFVYGPGQRRESLIPHLIQCKKRGTRPTIKNPSGGNDFIYVEDVAKALRMLLEKKVRSCLYNIGSGRLTSIYDITRIVYGRSLGHRPKLVKGFYGDISRIKKETGWKPIVDIDAGIRSMLNIEK